MQMTADQKPYVIVADHYIFIHDTIRLYLEDICELCFVTSGDECVEAVNARKPDLIICEAVMPDVDSRDLCRELGELIPCLFLSSLDRHLEQRACLLKPRHIYLTRPYTEESMVAAVKQLLPN